MKSGRIVVIVLCLYFIAISLAPPATGYEYSLYQSTPLIIWLLFGLLIVIGLALLILGAIDREFSRVVPGMGAISGAYIGYYALPYARGWEHISRFGADEFVHLGIVADILETGVSTDATYPGTNILLASISSITALPPESLSWVISVAFFLAFVVGVGYCSLALSNSIRLSMCALVIAIPLYIVPHRLLINPWTYAYASLVFSLATIILYSNQNRIGWLYLYVIFSLSLFFIHPFTFLLGLLAVGSYILTYSIKNHENPISIRSSLSMVTVITSFIGWHYYHQTLERRVLSITTSLFLEEESTGGGTQTADRAGEVGYNLGQLFWHFFVPNWGVVAVLFIISSVTILYLLLQIVIYKNHSILTLFIVSQFILGGFLAVFLLIVRIHGTNIFRMSQYLIFVSIFASAIGLSRLISVKSIVYKKEVIVVVVLVVCSPIIFLDLSTAYGTDNHLGTADVEGYEWHLDNKDVSMETMTDDGRNVYAYTYFGYDDTRSALRDDHELRPIDLPDRLGYDTNSSFGKSVQSEDDTYAITQTADFSWQHEPNWRHDALTFYTTDDLLKLHFDESSDKIYDNGNTEQWYVRAHK